MAVGFAVLFETGRRRVGGAVSRAQMNLPVICIYARDRTGGGKAGGGFQLYPPVAGREIARSVSLG